MKITNDVKLIGVHDTKIDLFEGLYTVPNGVLYNSYIILDDKIAVIDSVAEGFEDEWLLNIERELSGKTPDYIIIQHVEPDHSASADKFMKKYKNAKMIASVKAFSMLKAFYGDDYLDRRIIIADGEEFSLGNHTLKFFTAPMVHWPEVFVSYDMHDKILFSADAFGKFGTGDEPWDDEARRYYIGIVGKYGAQVEALFKKLSGLDIKTVCSLHGPVLSNEALTNALELYKKWSSYEYERDGIVIAYSSIYGNTKEACELLAKKIKEISDKDVHIYDLARSDKYEALADAFKYSTLVLASPSYNGEIFPPTREFINLLLERNYQSRRVAFVENGSWGPVAARKMKTMLESQKNISFAENSVKVISSLTALSCNEIDRLARELS
jgi:flavorubredoxin